MQEAVKENHILTIKEVAAILRCSKTHVSHVLAGKVPGTPRLFHIAMGRRKLVRREWFDQWMEANKIQC
jgi:excisionase family DNA binding protein